MRVLVAGATGVIGRPLVPLLRSVGHEVIGLSRSGGVRAAALEQAGVRVVIDDALDRPAVMRAVGDAAPDAVVNLLSAIPAEIDPRRMERDFAMTNRLRTVGTTNLIDAAQAAGSARVITEGPAYVYDPSGAGAANEDVPFWPNPPKQFAGVLHALRDLERLTARADGLVLRFGHLYGPGTIYAPDGSFVRQVRAGKVPIVGRGSGTFSFTHAHDAASAVVAALDKDVAGALNVVDDEPVPVREWLPGLARILAAPAPKHVPAVVARLVVGGWGVAFMTRLRGADNARARLSLDWRPRYPSWHEGFTAELGTGLVASPARPET